MTTSLQTNALSKNFAGVAALVDVSVRVHEREILGVIGPNGSGKTTLINLLSGVIAPTSGSIVLGERPLARTSPHQVARLGVARTFQNVRLFRELTVLENVMVTASVGRERGRGARRTAREAIALVGLEDYETELATRVPFPLQRRLEVARAIALKPRFVLLDEPAAGLNESESDGLLQTLLDIRDAYACGILLVDHDMRLMLRATDRIHVLAEGRSLADGSPEEVRHNPDVIRAYLGSDLPAHT